MFSERYSAVAADVRALSLATRSNIGSVLNEGNPRIAKVFFDPAFGTGGPLDEKLLFASRAAKAARYGNEVFAVAPIYVSSICRERCLYCNYRAANTQAGVDRIRLTDEELLAECEFLITEKGLRVLELVYASDPKMTAEVIARHASKVKALLERHGGGVVGLNAEPFDTDEYRRLAGSGVDFSVVWQETYDEERYAAVHPGPTKKSDFEYRLDCYGRMIQGGIPKVGIGVLSGLADWKFDWAMLMQHEAHLRDHYGRGAAILGVPRLKPAAAAEIQSTEFIPTDEEFLLAIATHNLFDPSTRVFVSTRESWELCTRMAIGGGCLFTFNCSTIPGGYSLGRTGNQFPTNSYDVAEFAGKLEALGLHPKFDWDFDSHPAPA